MRCRAILLALLLSAAAVSAQPAVPEAASLRGESAQTLKRLAEAEQKVINGKTADGIEDLQRILDEAGDDLVSLDGKHFRAARWFAHSVLSKLPADALTTYRNRIDDPARKLLEAGRRDRDPGPLWQLLDRYFVSRSSEEASLLLGDLLFERGEFRAAEQVCKRLLPDGGADVPLPGSKGDLAAVKSRTILAAIFAGELERARTDLAEFEKKHPGAIGRLAGKKASYADTLRGFLERRPRLAAAVDDGAWPTFGGDASRTGRLHGAIAVHWSAQATWSAPLERNRIVGKPTVPPAAPPYGHPVIFDGWVYLSDGRRVLGFELASGRAVEVLKQEPILVGAKGLGAPQCPTLTAASGKLFARIGAEIVCFESPRKGEPVREQWRLAPPLVEGKAEAVWEGAPLVAGGRMWAAFAHAGGGRLVQAVACYDPANPENAPARPAWVAEACDSPMPANQQPRHNLLTLAGRRVVFCSNTGAVAAFDARTGQRAWGVQYPRTNRTVVSVDPAAAVAFGGRVFAAPSDAARAYAFDAETGEELWQSGPIEGGQILGIARNRLVMTSTGPVRGIRGLDTVTGSYRDAGGWIRANGMLGYGQGLAGDDAILWPARDGLYFLDAESGDPIRTAPPLRTLSPGPEHYFGHLAFAAGWLVAVTPSEIRAYHTEAPPFSRPPANDREAFQTLIDGVERNLAMGHEAAARAALTEAARGELPRQYRAWAAARLLRLDPREPLSPAVQSLLTSELLGEWLTTEEGEITTLEALRDRRAGSAARSPPRSTNVRKPIEPPSPGDSLSIAAEQQLPPGSRPLLPIHGTEPSSRLFVASPADLFSVGTNSGGIVRHAPGHFTHAGELADGILAAGPLEIALYARDREPLWRFRVPETPLLPGPNAHTIIHTGDPPTPEMSSFAVAGGRLFARLGEHHLIGFDLGTGRIAWLLGSHGRGRFEPIFFPATPRFTPHYYCSERLAIVQLSDGRRWMVQASTGRVWNDSGSTFRHAVPKGFGAKTALAPWPSPPVAVDGDAVAIADGSGLVAFASLQADRPKRQYPIHGESSLTGEPPQLRRWGDDLFIAVRRNYGVEVQRMDAATARAAWTGATFLETSRIDMGTADADPQRIFLTTGKKLLGVNRDDGSVAWEASLPLDGSGQVRAGRRNLLVYPTEAIAEEPIKAAFDRVQRSFLRNPQPWRLPWLAVALRDSWQERTLPVLVFDSESGRRLAALRLPARGPGAAVLWEGDRGAAFAGDRIVWLK